MAAPPRDATPAVAPLLLQDADDTATRQLPAGRRRPPAKPLTPPGMAAASAAAADVAAAADRCGYRRRSAVELGRWNGSRHRSHSEPESGRIRCGRGREGRAA